MEQHVFHGPKSHSIELFEDLRSYALELLQWQLKNVSRHSELH